MSLLQANELHVTFGGVHAVQGASIEVGQGEIVGIIGPNGAGKSSLLGAIGGQLPVHQGSIVFDGEPITKLRPDQRARRGLVRSFQTTSEFANMTVYENLAVAAAGFDGGDFFRSLLQGGRYKEAQRAHDERIARTLEAFDMVEMANAHGSELSGGQRRLVEMMRCLMQNPKLILLDEPMVGVAPHLVQRIGDAILQIRDGGVAIVIIEHALEVVERLSDRVVVMADGEVIANGDFQTVINSGSVQSAYLG